jgi:hypothetical protein
MRLNLHFSILQINESNILAFNERNEKKIRNSGRKKQTKNERETEIQKNGKKEERPARKVRNTKTTIGTKELRRFRWNITEKN